MNKEQIKTKLERVPFRSFTIELISGRQIIIGRDSEILFPGKRPELVIVFTDDGLQHEFELNAVIELAELV